MIKRVNIPLQTNGLDCSKDPEKVLENSISACDGFTLYRSLLRKDWQAISVTTTCDLVRKRTSSEYAKCCSDCPEDGTYPEGGSGGGW